MAQIPLPQTAGRLSQSCDIYSTTGGNLDLQNAFDAFLSTNDLQASSGVDPLSFINSALAIMATNKPLGAIEKLEIEQTREVERIYGLGNYSYEPYRIVPKSLCTSLKLTKVVLYKEDFLKSVGFNSYNLYYQQAPFIIRMNLYNPSDPTAEPDVLLFFDCWITNNPFTFDLTSETGNLVKQNIDVECGRMFTSSAQFLYSGATTKYSKKNVKFNK